MRAFKARAGLVRPLMGRRLDAHTEYRVILELPSSSAKGGRISLSETTTQHHPARPFFVGARCHVPLPETTVVSHYTTISLVQ